MRQTGNNNLIWHLSSKYGFEVHTFVNEMIKYDKDPSELWISTKTDAWKSILQGKNEHIQKVYSIS